MKGGPAPLPDRDLGRPIRVVLFGGAFLEPAALELVARLDEHPETEFVAGFCQSHGFDLRHRMQDIVRRRKLFAPVVLGAYGAQAAIRMVRHPLAEFRLRRRVREPLSRIFAVPDIHASAVMRRLTELAPDLGLVYGSPILKPQLYGLPLFGTIGIHHGTLPQYRGKKTTFWEMYNREPTAGVAIQRINAGVDTGEILCTGAVATAGKRYGRVERELQQLGITVYMATVLAVKRGEARCSAQPQGASALYRQPRVGHILRLWWGQLRQLGGATRQRR